jgi:DNA-binding transcriptional ArsR family regulator
MPSVGVHAQRAEPAGSQFDCHPSGSAAGVQDACAAGLLQQVLHQVGFAVDVLAGPSQPAPSTVVVVSAGCIGSGPASSHGWEFNTTLDMQPYGCILSSRMDEVFKALADPSRRALLDSLDERTGQTLTELCSGLAMARQSVSKHLAVLEAANLISTRRQGREKLHYVNAEPHQRDRRSLDPPLRPGPRAGLGRPQDRTGR